MSSSDRGWDSSHLTDISGLLRCPRCRGPIQRGEGRLQCIACRGEFAVEGSVADFRGPQLASGRRSPSLQELLHEANGRSWPEVVRDHVERAANRSEALYESASPGRAAWKLLLNLHPGAAVLEIGGGTGLITSGIARTASIAVMVESRLPYVLLAHRRFQIYNSSDGVALLLVDRDESLPVRDATFDCVVLSGGLCRTDGEPGSDRSGLGVWKQLREARRVLKPGGQLFWIAENRFSYRRRWRFARRGV